MISLAMSVFLLRLSSSSRAKVCRWRMSEGIPKFLNFDFGMRHRGQGQKPLSRTVASNTLFPQSITSKINTGQKTHTFRGNLRNKSICEGRTVAGFHHNRGLQCHAHTPQQIHHPGEFSTEHASAPCDSV